MGLFTKFFPLEIGPKGAEIAEVACALMAALSIDFRGGRARAECLMNNHTCVCTAFPDPEILLRQDACNRVLCRDPLCPPLAYRVALMVSVVTVWMS